MSADHEKLAEATCVLKYDAMREQLQKIFSESTSASASSSLSLRVNEVNHVEPAIEQTKKADGCFLSCTPHLPPPSHKPIFTKLKVTFTKRVRNPVDTTGQTTRCGICDYQSLGS